MLIETRALTNAQTMAQLKKVKETNVPKIFSDVNNVEERSKKDLNQTTKFWLYMKKRRFKCYEIYVQQ